MLNFKIIPVRYLSIMAALLLCACDPGTLTSRPGVATSLTEMNEPTPPMEQQDPDPVGEMPEDPVDDPDPVIHAEPEPPESRPIEPIPDVMEPEPETMEEQPEPGMEDTDPYAVDSCGFSYPPPTMAAGGQRDGMNRVRLASPRDGVQRVAYLEPLPNYLWTMGVGPRVGNTPYYGPNSLTMPGYDDAMPLFTRGGPWLNPRRCYELPTGARLLTQAESYALWVKIVQETLWFEVDQTPGKRTVVGLRGAYPGTFAWHGNLPNRFNDTIVLLWRDDDGAPHVREYPVNTDTGARDFGYHNSSSLRPNRHYPYENAWHRSYNALRMGIPSYSVRDDANKNGHWDDDRNGWLSGGAEDHDRLGSGHNIHMASVEGSIDNIPVNRWSAGCQVIPGTDNWTEFIRNAWTYVGDSVDYYLLDVRDVASSVWTPCDGDQGSYDCPYAIEAFPFVDTKNTAQSEISNHDVYNCSDANESGPEIVYVLNVRESGTLRVTVATNGDGGVDPDVHLLWGNDANACLARGHNGFDHRVTPGRYLIVVDTWVNGQGEMLTGEYTLNVNLTP